MTPFFGFSSAAPDFCLTILLDLVANELTRTKARQKETLHKMEEARKEKERQKVIRTCVSGLAKCVLLRRSSSC